MLLLLYIYNFWGTGNFTRWRKDEFHVNVCVICARAVPMLYMHSEIHPLDEGPSFI